MKLDVRLKEWATERQSEFIDAVNECGSTRKAAKKLGITRGTLNNAITRLRRLAAERGYSPEHDMTHVTAPGFKVKGTSTYYDEDGKVRGQWVKTTADAEKVETALRAAVEALSADIVRAAALPGPAVGLADLATLYTLTDAHVGMKAWEAETGDDWDLDIAERVLVGAFAHLVASSPDSDVGVVCNLGDFMHYDSLDAVTPQHRNLLDSDSRFPKMVSVATRVLRRIIDLARTKHKQVIVVMAEGNHDMASSVWLRHLFALLYENEPRVRVLDDITPYNCLQHGETMLCFHHGHLSKNESLPLLFAASYPRVWGETKYRYCHTGHRHHAHEKDYGGMTVIQHPTIAARDAYAARGGWTADRAMKAITYHKKFGQVAQATVTPEMIA